jgi:hypothetical protein
MDTAPARRLCSGRRGMALAAVVFLMVIAWREDVGRIVRLIPLATEAGDDDPPPRRCAREPERAKPGLRGRRQGREDLREAPLQAPRGIVVEQPVRGQHLGVIQDEHGPESGGRGEPRLRRRNCPFSKRLLRYSRGQQTLGRDCLGVW